MWRVCSILSLITLVGLSTANAAVPVIDSVAPGAGIPAVTSVKIYGRNFNTTAANNIVYFGATKATITAAYADSIIVTVPVGAIYMPVTVTDTTTGLTAYNRKPYTPVFDNGCYRQDSLRFRPKVDFATSLHPPYVVAIGDVDGDGKPDLVSANRPSSTRGIYHINVFKNISSVGPITASSLSLSYTITSTTFRPANIKLADLDGDGRLDIIVTPNNSNRIVLYRNTSSSGSISFSTGTPFSGVISTGLSYSAYGVAMLVNETSIADFDRDGLPDLAVIATQRDSVNVLRNTLSSPLGATAPFPTTAFANYKSFSIGSSDYCPVSLITADLNNDGKPEIAISNFVSGSLSVLRDTSTVVGSIGFATAISISLPSGIGPFQLAAGDIDGDSKLDLLSVGHQLSATPTSHGLFLYKNNSTTGSLSFGSSVGFTSGLDQPRTLAIGDLNGDGKVDVAVANYAANTVSTFKNVSTGAINSSSLIQFPGRAVGVQPIGIAIGDIDGDTKPEIVVANSNEAGSDSTFSILQNRPKAYVDTIYGNTNICISSTTDTLKDSTIGGRWLTSNPFVASIDPVSGRVVPVSIGTFTATYQYVCGGDTAVTSKAISIISTPAVTAITGPTVLCTGLTFTLSNSTPGGVWGSLNTAVATINSTTGDATGVSVGSATITYGVSNSCGTRIVTYPVTVSTTPSPITGTTFSMCSGSSITLSSATAGGSWLTTAGTGSASASSAGVITGGFDGTAIITYRLSSGCFDTALVTILPVPSGISGSSALCQGATTALTTTSFAGVWTSSNPTIASIDAGTGDVFGRSVGSATISYTFSSTGCYATFPITVNSNPSPIGGARPFCEGSSYLLSNSTTGGTWSSSATGIATVVATTGTFTTIYAASAGTAIITYEITATGCIDTALITVNPIPNAITGPSQVCIGDSILLATTSTSGAWASSASGRASVSNTGTVYGRSAGTATISYTFSSTGCFSTRNIAVNTLPAAITGLSPICPGYTMTANTTSTGGTWSNAQSSIANIGAATGLVRTVSGGVDTIYYTITASGCKSRAIYTVYPAPSPIIGDTEVCDNAMIVLTDTTIGGFWYSGDTSIAVIDSVTGIVTGAGSGFATISYTTPTYGCSAFLSLRVNPVLVPLAVLNTSTGTTVCAGTAVNYTVIPINGGTAPTFKWFVNRVLVGTGTTLSYTPVNGDTISVRLFSNALCAVPDSVTSFVRMTVNPTIFPSVTITTGVGDTVCVGRRVTFTPIPVNGGTPSYTWKVNGVSVWSGPTWTFVPTNGDLITVVMNSTIACRNIDTVSHTKLMTVSPPVNPSVAITGSDTVCGTGPGIFTAVGINSGFSPTFQWQVNGFDYATGPTLAFPVTTMDMISVTMTSSFPCLITPTATAAKGPLTVVAVTVPSVSISAFPGYIVLPGTNVTMMAHVIDSGAAPIYRWFKNGLPIAGANKAVYVAISPNNGDVFVCKVTNTDACNGLTGYADMTIIHGDNIGVENVLLTKVALVITPNPNNGAFTLTGDFGTAFDEVMTMEVVNTVGQVVSRTLVSAVNGKIDEQITLNASHSSGMYFLSLKSAHMNQTMRFVVNE